MFANACAGLQALDRGLESKDCTSFESSVSGCLRFRSCSPKFTLSLISRGEGK